MLLNKLTHCFPTVSRLYILGNFYYRFPLQFQIKMLTDANTVYVYMYYNICTIHLSLGSECRLFYFSNVEL